MSTSIAVSKVVKTTTGDKDSYDILLKGQMRFDVPDGDSADDSTYSEMADIELKVKGINQRALLEYNKVFWIGSVKLLDLRDVQTTLEQFKAHDPYRISDHIIDQELWFDPVGDVRTRNEIRATYLDLEEQGAMSDTTFLQFLGDCASVDELCEENPEMMQAIQLYKHGYDYWGLRMQVYGGEIVED